MKEPYSSAGKFSSQVVGLGHYTENPRTAPLWLARQPENQHDCQAIAVRNDHGIVGHVPRAVAAALSPLCDTGVIRFSSATSKNDFWFKVPPTSNDPHRSLGANLVLTLVQSRKHHLGTAN